MFFFAFLDTTPFRLRRLLEEGRGASGSSDFKVSVTVVACCKGEEAVAVGGAGRPGAGMESNGTWCAENRFSAEGVEADGIFETDDAEDVEGAALVGVDRSCESLLLPVPSRVSLAVLALSRGLFKALGEGDPAML